MLPIFKPQHRVAGHLVVLLLASALHITIGDMNLERFEQLDAFDRNICGKSFVPAKPADYVHDELRASRIRKHSYGGARRFNYTDHDDHSGSSFGRRAQARESHYDIARRMSGGYNAKEGEIPWFVLLGIKFPSRELDLYCGGALIHNDLVITVGHCIEDDNGDSPERITAIFGLHEIRATQSMRVADKQCGFPIEGPENRRDVALIWLTSPIFYSQTIQPACLDLVAPVDPRNCFTAGFGFTNRTIVEPQKLIAAKQRECGVETNRYDKCWIGKGTGSPCHTDSGGGLYCMRDGLAYVSGLVGYGGKYCTPGTAEPVLYSDTYKLRDQIRHLFDDCNWEPSENFIRN